MAEGGQLRNPATLEAQVRRMLADRRARALVDNFVGQWLSVRYVTTHEPDPVEFPYYDENLRRSFGSVDRKPLVDIARLVTDCP